MIIDTHVHTSFSDGRTSVADTVSIASDQGVEILAITDHDTISAYPAAYGEAACRGIKLIAGVELSTRDEDGYQDVHVVGLKLDLDNRALLSALKALAKSRIDARRKLMDNVNEYMASRFATWVPARFEDVLRRAQGTVVKPHLAAEVFACAQKQDLAITEAEINRALRLPDIDVKNRGNLPMGECISLIHESGGVAVLAHPCEYGEQMDPVMKKFHGLGGEATEICKHRYKSMYHAAEAPISWETLLTMERRLNEKTMAMAREYQLKITASSDFHGKPIEPGMKTEDYGIDIEWLLD
jgi:predicted metal-dependent phosphoesterase TrpH